MVAALCECLTNLLKESLDTQAYMLLNGRAANLAVPMVRVRSERCWGSIYCGIDNGDCESGQMCETVDFGFVNLSVCRCEEGSFRKIIYIMQTM